MLSKKKKSNNEIDNIFFGRMNTFSQENGTWSDVDYTTGCDARRANWPAQQHFQRIGQSFFFIIYLYLQKTKTCFYN